VRCFHLKYLEDWVSGDVGYTTFLITTSEIVSWYGDMLYPET